jgi:hypothetical protein
MQTVAPKRAIQVVTKGRNVCVCAYSMPLTRPLRRLQGPNYQPTKFQLVIGYHPLDGRSPVTQSFQTLLREFPREASREFF